MSLAAAAVESLPPSSVPSLLTLSTGGGRKRKQHPSPPFPREEEISRGRELAPTPTDGRADGWKGGPRCFLSHIRTGPPSASSLFNEHRLKAPLLPLAGRGDHRAINNIPCVPRPASASMAEKATGLESPPPRSLYRILSSSIGITQTTFPRCSLEARPVLPAQSHCTPPILQ